MSEADLLLSRFKDLDFGVGGWTPFSSKERSSAFSLLVSKYLIMLLFVSATISLPVNKQATENNSILTLSGNCRS